MFGYGLVFSGGGAKRSYQIGVWKALEELGIPITAITGTSIGALNGAMLVQDDYELVELAWTNFSVEQVIDDTDEDEWESKKIYNKHFSILTIIKNIIISGGMELTPLTEALNEYIDEDKIRNSPIDFGLVTYSISDFKPLQIFKDEIPRGKLVDYLVASACFPAFKPIEIDNKKYIDGGFHDNVPIELMGKQGIKDIIVADISGWGVPKSKPDADMNVIYIKSNHDLGKTLEISPKKASENIELGYLDTLKTFNLLKGNYYYFTNNIYYNKNNDKYINILDRRRIRNAIGITEKVPTPIRKLLNRKFFATLKQYEGEGYDNPPNYTVCRSMAEICGEILGVEPKVVYTLEDINKKIIENYLYFWKYFNLSEYMNEISNLSSKEDSNKLRKEIKSEIKNDEKLLLIYLANGDFDNDYINRIRRMTLIINPKIVVSSYYIQYIIATYKIDVTYSKASTF